MMTTQAQKHNRDHELILTVAGGVFVAACLLVWTAAQITSRLWYGDWLAVTLWESPLLAWQLIVQSTTPPLPAITRLSTYYTTLTLLVALTTITFTFIWNLWGRHTTSDEPESAHWAERRDLKPLLVRRPQLGRLTLGTVGRRLVATEQHHSVAVIGPTGTGKTTGFAIPAILEWDGPVIATSIRADLLEATINSRRNNGKVWVYDPTGSTGQPSAGWSPLHACSDWQQAMRMAAWLVSTGRAGERGGLQDSDFWYAVAQKLLAPLLYAAARSGATMRDVVRWVDLQDEEEPIRILSQAGEADALQAFAATINREERSHSSAYTTTETVLAAFNDPGVQATTTRQPAMTPDQLLDGGNHTLYVCAPLDDQERLRPLFTALIEETVHTVYRRANHPDTRLSKSLLLVIDEAANIAPLPDLAQLASTARGVGIQLVTIWQDFAQIQVRYGTFAQTVINNHRAKVVLSGIADTPTLDYLSRLIGDQAVTEVTETRDNDGAIRSSTQSIRHRALAPPAALRQNATGAGVLVYGNLSPARITLRPPTSTPPLIARAGPSKQRKQGSTPSVSGTKRARKTGITRQDMPT
jgi:type IV secretion system protein VirD4